MHVVVHRRPTMRVKVPVWNSIVLVQVAVDAERTHESDSAKRDERYPDEPFDSGSKIIREPPAGEHEAATDEQDHKSVADAPSRSYGERAPPMRSIADEDADRGEMIRRERVSGAENESG
jgi:hypothetical protein